MIICRLVYNFNFSVHREYSTCYLSLVVTQTNTSNHALHPHHPPPYYPRKRRPNNRSAPTHAPRQTLAMPSAILAPDPTPTPPASVKSGCLCNAEICLQCCQVSGNDVAVLGSCGAAYQIAAGDVISFCGIVSPEIFPLHCVMGRLGTVEGLEGMASDLSSMLPFCARSISLEGLVVDWDISLSLGSIEAREIVFRIR